MDVTIVIPTKNAGELLREVLRKIFSQKTNYSYEVICVDSGSKDQTIDIIKEYDCKLYCIPPEDFGHGKTRNYGAARGIGEFIIFITQDAVPYDEFWIDNFVNAIKLDKDIAGGFGKHYPYPDCNPFDKRDLEIHFQGFGAENTIYWLEDEERYKVEEGYRHLLAYYSDNNSCMRRSVWEQYPYADVNFAEDQIWARQMIELGYKKVYCPFAAVYHSHNFKLSTYFKRYYDEYKGLYELHQFCIVKHWYWLVPKMYKHIFSELRYVKSLQMPFGSKLKWSWYCFWRNHCRYYGGFLGGKYQSFSPGVKRFLDRRISQQFKQRNA